MQITGRWISYDDRIARPVVVAEVFCGNGKTTTESFLLDTGADRTVFSESLLRELNVPVRSAPPGAGLAGIGGREAFALVTTVVKFESDEGLAARFHGEYAALTDPTATDLNILGRDVLDFFDVIVSKRGNAVILLGANHGYQVVTRNS